MLALRAPFLLRHVMRMLALFRYSVTSFIVLLTLALPTQAQGLVQLRLSHNGNFLPGGTEVIVIDKQGVREDNTRYQPEFLAPDSFPIALSAIVNRDRLDINARTLTTYPPTRQQGRLYFIYALTPDSVLYWSYSATRAQPKYDVVQTGVMSVAPVEDAEARHIIMEIFFTPPATTATNTRPESPTASSEGSETVTTDSAAIQPATQPVTSPAVATTQQFSLPLWGQIGIPMLLLGVIVALLIRMNGLRAELGERREELNTLRQQLVASARLPKAGPSMRSPPADDHLAKNSEQPIQEKTAAPLPPIDPDESIHAEDDYSAEENSLPELDRSITTSPDEADTPPANLTEHPESIAEAEEESPPTDEFPLVPPPPISEDVIRAHQAKKNQPPPEIVIVPDEHVEHPEAANDTLILDNLDAIDDAELSPAEEEYDLSDSALSSDASASDTEQSELMSRYQALMRDLDLYRTNAGDVNSSPDEDIAKD